MKKYLVPLAAVTALLLVSGCDTSGVATRIQEKSAVFNNLEPWQQRDIQNGAIDVGFSTDMVYMALGKPSKIVTTADAQETIWTYNNYYPPSAQSSPQVGINMAGGPNYASQVENANSPRGKSGIADTGSKGTAQTTLDVPDLPSDTLHVTFRNGQVIKAQLESESH